MGNRLAELLVPSMDEKVAPAMMAALMSACSLINAGAGTEEVRELRSYLYFIVASVKNVPCYHVLVQCQDS